MKLSTERDEKLVRKRMEIQVEVLFGADDSSERITHRVTFRHYSYDDDDTTESVETSKTSKTERQAEILVPSTVFHIHTDLSQSMANRFFGGDGSATVFPITGHLVETSFDKILSTSSKISMKDNTRVFSPPRNLANMWPTLPILEYLMKIESSTSKHADNHKIAKFYHNKILKKKCNLVQISDSFIDSSSIEDSSANSSDSSATLQISANSSDSEKLTAVSSTAESDEKLMSQIPIQWMPESMNSIQYTQKIELVFNDCEVDVDEKKTLRDPSKLKTIWRPPRPTWSETKAMIEIPMKKNLTMEVTMLELEEHNDSKNLTAVDSLNHSSFNNLGSPYSLSNSGLNNSGLNNSGSNNSGLNSNLSDKNNLSDPLFHSSAPLSDTPTIHSSAPLSDTLDSHSSVSVLSDTPKLIHQVLITEQFFDLRTGNLLDIGRIDTPEYHETSPLVFFSSLRCTHREATMEFLSIFSSRS